MENLTGRIPQNTHSTNPQSSQALSPFQSIQIKRKIELIRVLGKWSTQTGNSKIAGILAQCLVSPVRSAAIRGNAAREAQETFVKIEFAGSGKVFGNIEYKKDTTVGSLLDSLFWRLLGSPGQPCEGIFHLCSGDYDFNTPTLETLSSETLISDIMSNPSEKKLQLALTPFESNEQKLNYLKTALGKKPTQEQMDRILDIAQGITNDRDKSVALMAICIKLAEMGQVDRAIEIAGGIADDWSKGVALNALAPRLTTPEQVDKALEIVRTMTDNWDKAQTLEAIVRKITTPEQVDRALEIVGTMTDGGSKSVALNALAPRLTTPEQVDRALEIVGTMTDGGSKSVALNTICITLAEKGEIDRALDIAQGITNDRDKRVALAAIYFYEP